MRKIYYATRRAYRAAKKISVLKAENAVLVYMAAVTAMRTVTGKWDVCDPARWLDQREYAKTGDKYFRRPWHVSAACTRWMKATR